MIKVIEKLQQKIANEQQIIDRYATEVTVDWPAVQAEIRHKAFSEVIEFVKKLPGEKDESF